MNINNIIRSKNYELIAGLLGMKPNTLKNSFLRTGKSIANIDDVKSYIEYRNNRKPGIYKIECIKNGKVYIGSAQSISDRIKQHKKLLEKGEHNNKILRDDYILYGKEYFEFEILELIDEGRVDREYEIINSYPVEKIYNISFSKDNIIKFEKMEFYYKCIKYEKEILILINSIEKGMKDT